MGFMFTALNLIELLHLHPPVAFFSEIISIAHDYRKPSLEFRELARLGLLRCW